MTTETKQHPIAVALAEAVARSGLTQAQLAATAGLSQPVVSDIVRGNITPDRIACGTVVKVLRACGVKRAEAAKILWESF